MKTEPLVLFRLLVLSFSCGFLLAFGRDLILFFCRILTKLFRQREFSYKTNTVLQMLRDLLFCLAVGLTLAILLFYYSEGRIRAFSVLSLLLGFFLMRNLKKNLCQCWKGKDFQQPLCLHLFRYCTVWQSVAIRNE